VPVMDELVKRAGLDAVLTTLFGDKVVDIHRSSIDPSLQLSYGRGRPRPLFLGASPKVILANLSRPQLVRIYEGFSEGAATSGLGSSWTEFRTRLSEIRRRGFHWSRGELEPNVSGAAVPVFSADGEVAAGLALVGLTESLDRVGEQRLHALLTRAREEMQARIERRTPSG